MSGPIVRTGASPEFSKGWDRVFGGKTKKQISGKSGAKSGAAKVAKKAAKAVKTRAKKK